MSTRPTAPPRRRGGWQPAAPLGRAAPLVLAVAAVGVCLRPVAAAVIALLVAAVAIWLSRSRPGAPARRRADSVEAEGGVDAAAGGAVEVLGIPSRLVLWSMRLFVLATALAAQSLVLSLLALAALALATIPAFLAHPDDGEVTGEWTVPVFAVALGASSVLVWLADAPSRSLVFGAVVLMVIAMAAARLHHARSAMALAALESVGIYLLASTVGYFVLGLRFPLSVEAPPALVGLFDERITFPFSSGPTAPAAMAAAYLAGYLAIARQGITAGRILRGVCLVAAVVVMLASNGRVALLAGAAVGLLAYLSPHSLPRLAVPVILVMLFLPLWWPVIDSVASPAQWVVGKPLLDRGEGDNQLESLSGRTRIWDRFYDSYGQLPVVRKVFGYGADGQVKSGVSRNYAFLFTAYDDPRKVTAHSTVLQQALDAGWVGVTVLIVVLTRSARQLVRRCRLSAAAGASEPAAACLAMLVVFGTTAATEASLAPGPRQEQFWAAFVIVVVASLYRPERFAADSGDLGGVRGA